MMKLTLGFSPCPNDTFIFDAMVNQKIDTEGLEFEVLLEDVQTLNNWAKAGRLDFSKISYGVLPLILDNYVVLESGGALGKGVGPLLIAASPLPLAAVSQSIVAIPGENTTAHLLFSLAFPGAKNKLFKVFHEIEDLVLNTAALEKEQETVGVIIHENRFTYHLKGLHKLMDLGEYWEKVTNAPIPLGGIVANRNLPVEVITKVDGIIRKSLEYAYAHHYEQLAAYVQEHAREMSEGVMRQHIELYVNNYSLALGEDGRKAVIQLLDTYEMQYPQTGINRMHIFAGSK